MRLVQGNNQSGAVSTALSTTLKVQVFNAGTTTTAAGVVVEWVDPANPKFPVATSTTDGTGTASYTWTMPAFTGTPQLIARIRSEPRATVTFSATATAGTSTGTISAATTTSQTATKGTAVGVPPSVVVTDTQGNLVSGKDVVFTMTAGSGTLSPASPATVTTDASGLATLTSWTLGAAAGTNTVTAALAGYTGSPVTFNATGANALPTQIAKTSGDAQTNVTAGAAATAFTATVKDVSNVAVQNVAVLWTIVTGAGTLTGGQTTATATTDASGVSTTTLTTNATVGSFSVTASFVDATGTTRSVTFTGSTVAGASTKWLIRTQPSSNVSSGTPFSQQPILYLADANSNAVATAGVVCTAARASGSDTLAGTLTATTDSTGTATFVNLTFNVVGAGGANTLQFTGGSKTAATSNTVTVAPPVPVAVLWGTQPTTTTTGVVMTAFTVRVVDNTNTTVPADTSLVTIALVGSGTASGTLSVNASGGVATFSNVTVTGTGTFSFDASCSTFPVVRSSSFTSNAVGATNEPAGMTAFLGSSGKVLVSGATQLTQATIQFKDASTYTPATTTLGVTLSAPGVPPTGDTHLAQIQLPYHMTSGNGHGTIYCTPNLSSLGHKQLYMRCYAKVSDNWYGESTGVLKFFQPLTNTTSVTNRIIGSIHGVGSAALKWKLLFQSGTYTSMVINGSAVGVSTTYYSPQSGTGTIVRGQWHLYEMWVQANTAGNADGSIKTWIDGVLTHSFLNNCRWDGTGFSWLNAQIQSVYGGPTVVNAVPDDQYIWIASPYYVSTHA